MQTIMTMFATFVAFVGGVMLLTETINKLFNVQQGTAKLIISWVLSLGLAALGFWQQWGFLADCGDVATWQGWVRALLVGLGCGLCANKIYDREEIWKLLEAIFSIFKKNDRFSTKNSQKMNITQERDQKLQGLSLVVIRKRNDIKRRKDAIALQKLNDLMAEDDAYCSKKRDFIEKIDGFRKRKSTFDVNDPMRSDLEDEARHNEHMLSLLRNEHERNIHCISNRHMIARTALDDEDRQLSEWQEEEKGAIMLEHMERKEESDADNAQHEAE